MKSVKILVGYEDEDRISRISSSSIISYVRIQTEFHFIHLSRFVIVNLFC